MERGYRACRWSKRWASLPYAGILDVFSPGQTHPVRIEFFGEDVESIRAFDVQSQTSTATLQTVVIAPVFPLGRQQEQRQDGVTRLRAYLVHARMVGGVHHCESRPLAGAQLPSAWPWGIATFLTCMFPACLPASDRSPLWCRR